MNTLFLTVIVALGQVHLTATHIDVDTPSIKTPKEGESLPDPENLSISELGVTTLFHLNKLKQQEDPEEYAYKDTSIGGATYTQLLYIEHMKRQEKILETSQRLITENIRLTEYVQARKEQEKLDQEFRAFAHNAMRNMFIAFAICTFLCVGVVVVVRRSLKESVS